MNKKMDSFQAHIADRLKKLRSQRGWSQEHLGGDLFGNHYSYQRLEQGKQDIRLEEAVRLAEIFDIPLSELYAAGTDQADQVGEDRAEYQLLHKKILQVSVTLDGTSLGLERQIELLTKVNAVLV